MKAHGSPWEPVAEHLFPSMEFEHSQGSVVSEIHCTHLCLLSQSVGSHLTIFFQGRHKG